MTGSEIRLPRRAYTDANWFQEERECLFRDAWVFIGTEMDLKAAGDAKIGQAGPYPLLVTRDKSGTLRAFHNVCRHRGAQLVEEEGPIGNVLVCPYHRWIYGLDGKMRGGPHLDTCFPDLDKTEMGLKSAAVGIYRELVFANPNPEADFSAFVSGLEKIAWPHRLGDPELEETPSLIYDMKCDWKVFVENAIDGYHLEQLHEHTLGGPVPDENVWERVGDHLVWYATDNGGSGHRLPAKVRRDLARVPPLKTATPPGYGGVYFLFPTTLIVPTPFGFSVSSLVPLSAGRCELRVRVWSGAGQSEGAREYIPGFDPATGRISSDH